MKTADGKSFMDTNVYQQNKVKVAGVVTLYKRNAATFGDEIQKLNTNRHTIGEATVSPDYTLMEKQRIKTFSRDVFDQLRAVPW